MVGAGRGAARRARRCHGRCNRLRRRPRAGVTPGTARIAPMLTAVGRPSLPGDPA